MAAGGALIVRTGLPLVLISVVAGCMAGADQSGESGDVQPPSSTGVPAASDSGRADVVEVPDEILGRILDDAAERLGVGRQEIEVLKGRPETWNDGSLGCPEPGMFYTQALVDGYHVVVAAAGEQVDYRVDRSGGFRICEDPADDGLPKTPDE